MVRVILGVLLLVVGAAVLGFALTTPPNLYTYEAEQIRSNTELTEQMYLAASRTNESIVSSNDLSPNTRESVEKALSRQNKVEVESNELNQGDYLTDGRDLYVIQRTGISYSFESVSGIKKLQILSVTPNSFSNRDLKGIDGEATEREVINKAILQGEVEAYTLVDTDHRIIAHNEHYYIIESHPQFYRLSVFAWNAFYVSGSLIIVCGMLYIVSRFK